MHIPSSQSAHLSAHLTETQNSVLGSFKAELQHLGDNPLRALHKEAVPHAQDSVD